MNLGAFGKQTFMPSTLCFGDFTVLSKEGYDLILDKFLHFNLKRAPPRKGFDPKGYIDFSRKKVNLGGYDHIPYPYDDTIRNMEEKEVEVVIDEYNRGVEHRMKEIQETELLSSSEKSSGDKESRGPTNNISKLRIEDYKSPLRDKDIEEGSDTDTRQMAY